MRPKIEKWAIFVGGALDGEFHMVDRHAHEFFGWVDAGNYDEYRKISKAISYLNCGGEIAVRRKYIVYGLVMHLGCSPNCQDCGGVIRNRGTPRRLLKTP